MHRFRLELTCNNLKFTTGIKATRSCNLTKDKDQVVLASKTKRNPYILTRFYFRKSKHKTDSDF